MQKPLKRQLIFRPSREPSTPLPFGARSVGIYRVPPRWREKEAVKDFVQLFWSVQGAGMFELDGCLYELPPGHVFYYLPGDLHSVRGSDSGNWEYRWLTIDGGLAAVTITAFGLGRRPWPAGNCPEDLFQILERRIRDHTPHGQNQASAAAYAVICAAANRHDPEKTGVGDLTSEAIGIIETGFAGTGLNVSTLADRLGVHRCTLARRFQEQRGMSVAAYLRAVRMQKAMTLLKDTRLTVAETASACGYSDPNYFCKAVRHATGMSPRQFRES